MLHRLPYTYTVVSIKKGHRKLEPHSFGGWVEVEIPHVSSGEAPVSMRWTERWAATAAEREVRWFEGSNWSVPFPARPSTPGSDFRPEDLARMGEIERQVISRRIRSPSFLLAYALATKQRYPELVQFLADNAIGEYDPAEIREAESSDRQMMEDNIIRGARNLLFVDGQLWVRDKEPCYGVHQHNTIKLEIHEASAAIPMEWNPGFNCLFRADRLDDALDLAREMGADDFAVPNRIEVLIPEAVQFRDEEDALRRSIGHVVQGSFSSLRDAPAETVQAWLALRESLRGDQVDMEAAAACLKRMSGFLDDNRDLKQVAERMQRRWELRPMETGQGFTGP